jgi:hypothetical protein
MSGKTDKSLEYLEVLLQLSQEKKVLFAPKNGSHLKVQYPELGEIEEFKSLNEYEMLFVWGMSCATSPFLDPPVTEEDRMNRVIDFAYPTDQMRKTKKIDFAKDYPANIKRAIARMRAFSFEARIEEQVFLLRLRENCKTFIAQDVISLSPEEQDKYWINVQRARREMVETRHTVENGAMGLANEAETFVPKIRRDLISLYHKRKR